jgi:F420-dependent oxidoreductase-like protein
MRIGISTNPSSGGGRPATVDDVIEQVAGFARGGFATAAFAHLAGLDPLMLIALTGRAVPRIELATAVVPIYTRHPALMAQQALTAQAATGGRLALGIGLSHRPVVEERWGLSFERPVEYMREYLAILRPLLRGEAVDYTGKRLSAHVQLTIPDASPPPLLLAALGERMLRLAGEQTDGTALWLVGAKTLASHVTPIINEAARAAGRPAPRIVVGLPMCVTSDPAAARERAARSMAGYGNLPSYRAMLDREGAAGPADVLVTGSETEVERQLQELEAAGATDFTATPVGSSDERQRTFEFLRAWVANGRGAPV